MHLSCYFSLEISYGHTSFALHFYVVLELAPIKLSFIPWQHALLPKVKLLTQEFWAISRTQWSDPVFTGFMWKIKNWFYWVAQKLVTNTVCTQLDNIKHSFERFFPRIQKLLLEEQANNLILQLQLDFPIWIYGQHETHLSVLQSCFGSDATELLSTFHSHLALSTPGTSENWNCEVRPMTAQ